MMFYLIDLLDKKPNFVDRFWSKVYKTEGCWLWTSATTGRYGIFWVGGKKRSEYAHRVSWMISNKSDIPSNKQIMHSCDNTLCVNPEHLSIGTCKENVHDSMRKGRRAIGERNGGGVKLRNMDVQEILMTKGVIGSTRAARMYGVSSSVIKAIRRREIWKHIKI